MVSLVKTHVPIYHSQVKTQLQKLDVKVSYFNVVSLQQPPSVGFNLRVCDEKIFFLFLNQNICCGYSKEPSQ